MLITGKESKDTRLMRLIEELIEVTAAAKQQQEQPPVVKVEPVVQAWSVDVFRDSEGKISKLKLQAER